MSKKPKTLDVSPALAVPSSDSFSRDLARITPRIEKGIEKEVRKILPIPNQKGREINTLVSPKIRLKIPLKEELPLIMPLIFVSSCPKILIYTITQRSELMFSAGLNLTVVLTLIVIIQS